jgi:hypothetical protein
MEETVGDVAPRRAAPSGRVGASLGLIVLGIVVMTVAAWSWPVIRVSRDGVEAACAEALPTRKAELASVDLSHIPSGWECRASDGEVLVRLPE